jgi:hypothetical protein
MARLSKTTLETHVKAGRTLREIMSLEQCGVGPIRCGLEQYGLKTEVVQNRELARLQGSSRKIVCTECKVPKSIKEFYAGRNICIECCRTKARLEKSTRKWIRYGIPQEIYEKTLKLQESKCAICGKDSKLCIDHCHVTKQFRGFVCLNCNLILGFAGDNISILQKAIEYLKNPPAKN